MADANRVTVDVTTGIGTLSFPRVFSSTAGKNDKGETVYDVQFLIPKTQRDDVRELLRAIQKVGKAKWGDNWRKVRQPLRDGDKEREELTEDGSTKGDKYPERLGCYFINARSTKPVGVYDRTRVPIVETGDIYAGCKAKIAVTFYPYSQSGNHGIGCGLNGVQKVADGESIGGGGKPSVESMFDMIDEDEDLGLEDEVDIEDEVDEEPTPPPAKKAAAKRAPAKKAAAKKAAAPPADEVDDLDDVEDVDNDDLYADLDDEDL